MPFMKNGKRDYEREKKWDHANGRIKDRAERNAARAQLMKEGKVRKGDGKDVGHITALSKGGKNTRSNLRVESSSSNRSFSRNKDGSMRSETSKKERKRGK